MVMLSVGEAFPYSRGESPGAPTPPPGFRRRCGPRLLRFCPTSRLLFLQTAFSADSVLSALFDLLRAYRALISNWQCPIVFILCRIELFNSFFLRKYLTSTKPQRFFFYSFLPLLCVAHASLRSRLSFPVMRGFTVFLPRRLSFFFPCPR